MFALTAKAQIVDILNPRSAGFRKSASLDPFKGGQNILRSPIFEALSSVYCISPRVEDYVFLVAHAVTADVANDNGDLFPRDELLRFDEPRLVQVYRTFQNGPFHQDHQASDRTKALGFIPDCTWMFTADKHWVDCLIAIDAKKRPDAAEAFESGKATDVSMGCGLYATPIETPDGEVPLGSLVVGQLVRTHKGRFRPVTKVFRRTVDPAKELFFWVSVQGTVDPIGMTGEHPFLALRAEKAKAYRGLTREDELNQARSRIGDQLEFVRLDELDESDFIAIPVDREVKPSDRDTEAWARLVGYYAGDGSMTRSHSDSKAERLASAPVIAGNTALRAPALAVAADPYRVTLSFGQHEFDYFGDVSRCARIIDPEAIVLAHPRKSANVTDVTIKSQVIADGLLELVGEYSDLKRFSGEVMHWSPASQLHLVGAFINADGHQSRARGHAGSVYFSSCNRALTEQMQEMLLRNNIPTLIQRRPGMPGTRRPNDHFQVNVVRRYVNELAGVASCVLPIEHGQPRLHYTIIFDDFLLVQPRIEEEAYDGEVFNVEVEEDNSYVANGVAVHNCLATSVQCDGCRKVARTEAELCWCLRNQKRPFGPRNEICRGVTFSELSWVGDGADPDAMMRAFLGKAAGRAPQARPQPLAKAAAARGPLIDRMGLTPEAQLEINAFYRKHGHVMPQGMIELAERIF